MTPHGNPPNDIEPLAADARCRRCGYSLAGLPSVHTCPECGLEYDPLCRVIELQPAKGDFRQVWLGLLLIALLGWVWLDHGMKAGDEYFLALLVGAVLWSLVRGSRHAERAWLILNHRGVRLQEEAGADNLTPWTRLHCARWRWLSGRLSLESADGIVLATYNGQRLGGATAAKWCALAITQAREAYRATPPGTSTPDPR
ncbi:MAG: hypothetical protein PVJ57_01855 [Phycisphaerae bacterium]|jgi:hypothetical protein